MWAHLLVSCFRQPLDGKFQIAAQFFREVEYLRFLALFSGISVG